MVRPLKIGVQLPEVEYEYTWPLLGDNGRHKADATARAFRIPPRLLRNANVRAALDANAWKKRQTNTMSS